MLICPHIIYGCFRIAVTELSCGDKDPYGPQIKTIYYLTLYRKSLLMGQTSETEKAYFHITPAKAGGPQVLALGGQEAPPLRPLGPLADAQGSNRGGG